MGFLMPLNNCFRAQKYPMVHFIRPYLVKDETWEKLDTRTALTSTSNTPTLTPYKSQ